MPDLPWPVMVMSLAPAQAEVMALMVEAVAVGDPLAAMCTMTANVPLGNVSATAAKIMLPSCKKIARRHADCAATDAPTRSLAVLFGPGKITASVDMSVTCAPTARSPAMLVANRRNYISDNDITV